MEEIIAIKSKLEQIAEARKLNAKMRSLLLQRLQKINAEIYINTHQKEKKIPFNRQDINLWGMSSDEYSKLAQLFWGKFHIQTQIDQNIESIKPNQLTSINKLYMFLNQSKSSRQKALILSSPSFHPTFFDIQTQISIPIRIKPYSIHDVLRFYIFFKIFGSNFPINSLYPHISSRTMRNYLKSIENDIKNVRQLNSIGINKEELQRTISDILDNL